jgi:hypothetical protein
MVEIITKDKHWLAFATAALASQEYDEINLALVDFGEKPPTGIPYIVVAWKLIAVNCLQAMINGAMDCRQKQLDDGYIQELVRYYGGQCDGTYPGKPKPYQHNPAHDSP